MGSDFLSDPISDAVLEVWAQSIANDGEQDATEGLLGPHYAAHGNEAFETSGFDSSSLFELTQDLHLASSVAQQDLGETDPVRQTTSVPSIANEIYPL